MVQLKLQQSSLVILAFTVEFFLKHGEELCEKLFKRMSRYIASVSVVLELELMKYGSEL